ncbi:MAG TPA: RNA polymerase-associated protein RapA, partial [Gammaproteobacteria bacterium]|nr:RNA polymerase-associated protein RapA [Gammaproteobacteria bacterium]
GTDEDGKTVQLEEGRLNNFIQLNRPTERLFSGQIDKDAWFELRYQSLQQLNRLAKSDLYGLTGCRTSLIPHQLYIAHEVANRYAPRVLLADEVGLGKTIEAGLILHHQLLTERARRILILVPESLLHQWLVEMLRRFNLYFSIFDEERCQAVTANGEHENPFQSEQLVLCTLEFLSADAECAQQAVDGDWDLLVVDEAHHLQWSPQQASPEYCLVEQLAVHTGGVLLLTATPEQLGKTGHFARLRLLDPDRFPDFDTFVEEENSYEPIARAVEVLLGEGPLDETTLNTLADSLGETDNPPLLDRLQHTDVNNPENAAARQALVEHLLDRHGTGRVLFRNTRAAVKGFPQRQVTGYPLPMPTAYQAAIQSGSGKQCLTPELLYQATQTTGSAHWTQLDPRVSWLSDTLSVLKPHKVLVITASAMTALDLADHLRTRYGVHSAVFHEGMNLVERDRAAAFFSDADYGTQVLVCSEIGSEGRNFQFAHQLILFDLPLNPDLLEQRIGRLDRIGQSATIQIHVPYLEQSAQAVLFHWYQEGLSAFEHTCPAGQTVYTQMGSALSEALSHPGSDTTDLIQTTRSAYHALNDALHRGRDKLLEYNSCRPHIANDLQLRALADDAASTLPAYMDAVFDTFGVNSEEQSVGSYIIRPGDHMLSRFPGLPDDGMTITYQRETALSYEDMQYISWEHPMVIGAMDLVLGNESGNTALTSIKYRGTRPGTLLLECLYILDSASSSTLQSNRYLPPTTIRVVMDEQGRNHEQGLSHDYIQQHREVVSADTAARVVRAREQMLRKLVDTCETQANTQAPGVLDSARQRAQHTLSGEIDRLRALRQVNPNVRDEEIEYFEQQLALVTGLLDSATLRLDAVRVIVST